MFTICGLFDYHDDTIAGPGASAMRLKESIQEPSSLFSLPSIYPALGGWMAEETAISIDIIPDRNERGPIKERG